MTFPPKGPAVRFDHDGQVIRNINQEFRQKLTVGQRASDRVDRVVCSWPFIIYQSMIIAVWIGFNIYHQDAIMAEMINRMEKKSL